MPYVAVSIVHVTALLSGWDAVSGPTKLALMPLLAVAVLWGENYYELTVQDIVFECSHSGGLHRFKVFVEQRETFQIRPQKLAHIVEIFSGAQRGGSI